MSKRRGNLVRIHCPHCTAPAITRTSKTMTPLYREIYYSCTNLECGASFLATHEIIRVITPSLIPNPDVRLPIAPLAARRAADRFLDRTPTLPAANDDIAPDAIASG